MKLRSMFASCLQYCLGRKPSKKKELHYTGMGLRCKPPLRNPGAVFLSRARESRSAPFEMEGNSTGWKDLPEPGCATWARAVWEQQIIWKQNKLALADFFKARCSRSPADSGSVDRDLKWKASPCSVLELQGFGGLGCNLSSGRKSQEKARLWLPFRIAAYNLGSLRLHI